MFGTSEADLSLDQENELLTSYADQARFKGKTLGLNGKGRHKLSAVINCQVNEKSIDRLSKLQCSNAAEGFMGAMATRTQGKRIHMTKNLQHHVKHVVATRSNASFGDKVLESVGVAPARLYGRTDHIKKCETRKAKQRIERRKESYKLKRYASKQIKGQQMDRASRSKHRHKRNKVALTEDGRAANLSTQQTAKRKSPPVQKKGKAVQKKQVKQIKGVPTFEEASLMVELISDELM